MKLCDVYGVEIEKEEKEKFEISEIIAGFLLCAVLLLGGYTIGYLTAPDSNFPTFTEQTQADDNLLWFNGDSPSVNEWKDELDENHIEIVETGKEIIYV